MAVHIDVALNLDKAEQEAEEFSRKVAWELAEAAAKGEKGFERFAGKSADEMRKLADKTAAEMKRAADKTSKEMEKAAEAAKKLWEMEAIENYAQGVKLIVGELDILNDAFGETINKAVEFGEVGGKIGGIWGAVIGAGIGAIEGHKDKVEAAQKEEIAAAQEVHDKTIATQLAVLSTLTKIYEARDKKTKELAKEHAKAEAEAAKKAAKAHEEAAKAAAKAWADGWAQIREDAARGVQLAKTPAEVRAEFKAAQAEYDALLAKSREGGGRFKSLVAEDLGAAKTRLDAAKSAMDGLGTATKATAKELKEGARALAEWNSEASAWYRAQSDNAFKAMDAFGAANQRAKAGTDEQIAGIAEMSNQWNTAKAAIEDWSTASTRAIYQVQDAVDSLGAQIAQDFGAGAVETGFGILFDNIAAGEKAFDGMGKAMAIWVRDFAKMTGTKLIIDGIANELIGIASWPLGMKQIAAGTAEIAAGLAMGGVGVLAGRRASRGGGDDRLPGAGGGGSLFGGSLSLGKGAMGGGNTSNTNNTYIIQALDVGDRELWERLGARVERGRRAFKRAGGKLFDGRD